MINWTANEDESVDEESFQDQEEEKLNESIANKRKQSRE